MRLHRRSGVGLVEMTIALVILLIAGGLAVGQFIHARDRAYVAEMTGHLEHYLDLEQSRYKAQGHFATLQDLARESRFELAPDVEVDSVSTQQDRVYLRVRHRKTDVRCSTDFSPHLGSRASDRVQCFGGPDEAPRERFSEGDAAERVVDTVALGGRVEVPAAQVFVAPVVDDPEDQVGLPGSMLSQTFQVRNPGTTSQVFSFTTGSSDPGVATVPLSPLPVTIPAGGSVPVSFSYSVPDSAREGSVSSMFLQAQNVRDASRTGTGRFAFTTLVSIRAPLIDRPADRVEDAGTVFRVVWPVENRSNGRRRFTLTPTSGGDVQVVSAPVVRVLGPGERFDAGFDFRLQAFSDGGTHHPVRLSVVDQDASDAGSASSALDVMTRVVVAAPQVVAVPVERAEDPGSEFTQVWTVTGTSNQARVVRIGVTQGDDYEVVASSGTGLQTLPRGGTLSVQVTYRLRDQLVAGTTRTVGLTATDEIAPAFHGEGVASVRANLVLRSPVLEAPGDQALGSGVGGQASFVLRNASNGPRRFALDASSGDLAVVGDPQDPAVVEVPAFGSVSVGVSFRTEDQARGGTSTRVRLKAVDVGETVRQASGDFGVSIVASLQAPLVSSPAGQGGNPGGSGRALYRVTNRSNVDRTVRFHGTSANAGIVTVGVDPGGLLIPAFGWVDVPLDYTVNSRGVAETSASLSLSATDASRSDLQGSGSMLLTVNTVLASPTLTGAVPMSGRSGESYVAEVSLENRSNVARTFVFETATSNAGVVGSVPIPRPVTVDAYAVVRVQFPFTFGSTPVSDLVSRLSLVVRDGSAAEFSGSTFLDATRINRAPTASIGIDNPGSPTGTPFQLRSNAMDSDGRVLTYAWYLRDVGRGGNWVYFSDQMDPLYSFARPGSYELYLVVGDNNGGVAEVFRSDVSVANRLPSAAPTAGPDGAFTGTDVQGQAHAADPDGTVVAYRWYAVSPTGVWSFVGDQETVTTRFSRPGTWYLYVTVTDDQGAQSSAFTAPISVLNRAPSAAPTAGPDGAFTGTDVQGQAHAADPDGTVVAYRWYAVSPTGVWSFVGDQEMVTTRFSRPGTWYLYVTVTDDQGAQSSAFTAPISVLNRAPSVTAGFNPDAQVPGSATSLAATGVDPDGTVVSYVWYLIDPSGVSSYAGTGSNVDVSLGRPGSWRAEVVVTDDQGAEGRASTGTITVIHVYGCTDPNALNFKPSATADDGSCRYNRAPNALLDVVYPSGRDFVWVGEDVSLDGRRSWDPDGDAVSGNLSAGLTGTQRWDASGDYAVTLVVSDGRAQGSQTQMVHVKSKIVGCMDSSAVNYDGTANWPGTCQYNRPPVADLRVVYPSGRDFVWVDEEVGLDGRGSSDPDGDVLTGNLSAGLTGVARWNGAGDYPVTLTVSDGQAQASQTQVVRVKPKIVGCMDPGALNYEPGSNWPGTCVYNEPPQAAFEYSLVSTDGLGHQIWRVQDRSVDVDGILVSRKFMVEGGFQTQDDVFEMVVPWNDCQTVTLLVTDDRGAVGQRVEDVCNTSSVGPSTPQMGT